jgi:glycosyltransferase involved in cell wall biosynthesis
MISGRDIVVLSDDWNGLPTSTVHLMRQFLRDNRIFWLNLVSRMPKLRRSDLTKVTHVARRWMAEGAGLLAHTTSHQPTLVPRVTTPIIIPYFKPIVRRLNGISLKRHYEKLCRAHQIQRPILLTTWPSAVDFVKSVDAAPKIYYCVDDWPHYPGLNSSDWRQMEEDLLEHTDAIVATSSDLVKKGRPDRATLYLPQGVDFDHFRRGADCREPIAALEEIPRPIVGFFGLVSSWVDLQLLSRLSEHFPNVSFVIIGRSELDLSLLRKKPNVYCLGAVAYADLPQYARYFDVGLIPFVIDRLTRAVNPLKLYEYFALGLPVLATRLPELERIEGPIELASTPNEFCEKLRVLMARRSLAREQEAISIASVNTWRRRAEQFSVFLGTVAFN